jgi:hypothetical protein
MSGERQQRSRSISRFDPMLVGLDHHRHADGADVSFMIEQQVSLRACSAIDARDPGPRP